MALIFSHVLKIGFYSLFKKFYVITLVSDGAISKNKKLQPL